MATSSKRMKRGLRWSDHRAPSITPKEIAASAFAALVVTAGWLYVSWSDAQAEMMEAQAGQIKAEVALVTILNGDPLVLDKESGMVALAKVETTGEMK